MPDHVLIGRDEGNFGGAIYFSGERAILKMNTYLAPGTELEIIPPGQSGLYPAMILWKKKWSDIYFLIERNGWTEDDYFSYAHKRFRELKVGKP